MSGVRTIRGEFNANGRRVLVLAGRFNDFIVERLVSGALHTLVQHGADEKQLTVAHVPGAYELPLAARKAAESGQYDAIVALAAVVRGATPHFEYVAGECASGLARVMHDTGVPVGFGVLTVETLEQAIERAGSKAGNKGADAALAALEMISVLERLEA